LIRSCAGAVIGSASTTAIASRSLNECSFIEIEPPYLTDELNNPRSSLQGFVLFAMPAQAGSQVYFSFGMKVLIPACAGMTERPACSSTGSI